MKTLDISWFFARLFLRGWTQSTMLVMNRFVSTISWTEANQLTQELRGSNDLSFKALRCGCVSFAEMLPEMCFFKCLKGPCAHGSPGQRGGHEYRKTCKDLHFSSRHFGMRTLPLWLHFGSWNVMILARFKILALRNQKLRRLCVGNKSMALGVTMGHLFPWQFPLVCQQLRSRNLGESQLDQLLDRKDAEGTWFVVVMKIWSDFQCICVFWSKWGGHCCYIIATFKITDKRSIHKMPHLLVMLCCFPCSDESLTGLLQLQLGLCLSSSND